MKPCMEDSLSCGPCTFVSGLGILIFGGVLLTALYHHLPWRSVFASYFRPLRSGWVVAALLTGTAVLMIWSRLT